MNFKTFSAVVALPLIVAAGAASAADLPTRKPAPAPVYAAPIFTWTGFYVGLQGGWSGAGHDRVGLASNNPAIGVHNNVGNLAPRGGFIGGRVGYDYQMPGSSFVLGVVGDLNYDWMKRSIGGIQTGVAFAGSSRIDWDGSLRLKAGYAFDRFLVYATGGVAAAHEKYALGTSAPLVSGLRGNSTHWGWTLGGGVQYAVTNNLIVGLEYRYTQLQKKTYTGAVLPAGAISTIATPNFHRIAATADWKF